MRKREGKDGLEEKSRPWSLIATAECLCIYIYVIKHQPFIIMRFINILSPEFLLLQD
jgi:hypothetical protein